MSFLEQTSAITLQDSRISYFKIGKGEPVFFLHGNPGTKRDFSEICKVLAEKGFKCYSIDRPGHMNSEELIPEEVDEWLDAKVFSEFIENICDGKAHIVGYSLGCFLACKLAEKYPENVKSLTLIAPFMKPNDSSEKPSSIPALSKNPIIGTILGVLLPLLTPNKMTSHFENVFHPEEVALDYIETYLPRYTRFETLIAMMSDKNSMINICKEVHQDLNKIKCPVNVISGKMDAVCSAEEQVEVLKEALPDLNLKEFESAGHGLPYTHAEEIAELLEEYFKPS